MDPTKKELSASIGKAIQFWRKIEDLEQKDLGELMGTNQTYISRVERAHGGISQSRVNDFAKLLGVSPYTILSGMPIDEEIKAILKIYSDIPFKLTKEEMEILFYQKVVGGADPEKFYRHILGIARGGEF